MEYNFRDIEKKWQKQWVDHKPTSRKKMNRNKILCTQHVPYPSGAGLHVGHPLDTLLRTFMPATNDCKVSMY